MKIPLFVALSCILCSLGQATDPTQLKVAVVEGAPVVKADAGTSLLKTNLDEYIKSVYANGYQPDIIVLPEFGLTGRTDDSKFASITSTELNDKNTNLTYINNIAKDKKAVIVVNLIEDDDGDLYSTTLVLDGGDKLLAKYRKINLNETEKKLSSSNDVATFSKWGITIGLLSGDDILYDEPANKLIKDDNAILIIYTTSMVSVAPFKTASSLHAGFAKTHGVNLLVASLNDPSNGVSGSGIYTPCSVTAYISATPGSQVTTGTIDTTPKTDCSKQDVLVMGAKGGTDVPISKLPRYNYDGLNTTLLTKNVDNQEYCNGSFCCSFTVSTNTWPTTEFYRAAVSDDQKVCGLLYCTDKDKVESCGVINQAAKTIFSNIVIKTTDGDDSFLPYILQHDMKPGSDLNNTKFLKDDDGANITVTTLSDVIAVGIVSTKSGASSLEIFVTSLIAMFFLLKQL